jgi:hypothetical protein
LAHKRQWGSVLDANALKGGSSGETTPEEKSFFSEYQGSASSIWRKALPVGSAPIHQKLGRADLLDIYLSYPLD